MAVELTAHAHGAGCACKIGAADLARVLANAPVVDHEALLVGSATVDDAAVYRLRDDLALVQSVDFFTAIVDDPYDFGRIAAANALSDIYAMGAEPLLALNLVAYSLEALGDEGLSEILRGGADVARTAGVAIGGGHTIDDPEPKYGMAVTGVAHPDRIVTNAGGRPGDELFLTKPVGVGLVTTAAQRGLADRAMLAAAIAAMTELNADASRAALAAGARAMTDVTGFGLLGHLHELCRSSGCAAELAADRVPLIDGALELAGEPSARAGGSRRNASHSNGFTEWQGDVDERLRFALADANTSGGLLIAVPRESAGDAPGTRVGRLVDGPAGSIIAA
ncbi:MAG: selenide, water dikinase SelD [Solirubrobacterales bacterium]